MGKCPGINGFQTFGTLDHPIDEICDLSHYIQAIYQGGPLRALKSEKLGATKVPAGSHTLKVHEFGQKTTCLLSQFSAQIEKSSEGRLGKVFFPCFWKEEEQDFEKL